MGRVKGSKMSEEAKQAMRARRQANKEGKANALATVADNIRHLTFDETETAIKLILEHHHKMHGDEEQRLLKQKAEIEERLMKLKG